MSVTEMMPTAIGEGAVAHRPPVGWSPGSWRDLPITQQPDWPDLAHLHQVTDQIGHLPPLVLPREIQQLSGSLADVAEGRAFLFQAGDCAERFDDCTEERVRGKLRVILQAALLLAYGAGLPVVKVGRIAGQFGKPRSKTVEYLDGAELPVFRGDNVNNPAPTARARTPDPERMLRAYHHSSATLNVLHGLTKGGFAGLSQAHAWNQEFVRHSPAGREYERVAEHIAHALRFMAACGADLGALGTLHQAQLYTSHEALLPDYEEALTRLDTGTGSWFDTSAHMVWVGERTRQTDGAHVEFLSGIANPIGVKVGPNTTPGELVRLCDRLDPGRVPGRLVLIARMGADRVESMLPPLIRALRREGRKVVWACDPMHGNTFTSGNGFKTRRFSDLLAEVSGFFAVHRVEGSFPGGIHLELTGDDVTECLGGAEEILDMHLPRRYETACDPRLNAGQSIEMAFRVAELLTERDPARFSSYP